MTQVRDVALRGVGGEAAALLDAGAHAAVPGRPRPAAARPPAPLPGHQARVAGRGHAARLPVHRLRPG